MQRFQYCLYDFTAEHIDRLIDSLKFYYEYVADERTAVAEFLKN